VKTLPQISPAFLDLLLRTDTCSLSNAIETFRVRMRNEGYVHGDTHCMIPHLPPIAGYAVTARMRASAPPISGPYYYQRTDWWQYVASNPGPKIIVVEDVDRVPGIGALFGEIHARISKALGCTGYVTNGTVRDLAAIRAMPYQCFASGVSVSHAYAHIIEFGQPVEIGGLQISSGDLLHGDCNGVHSVPLSVADQLPAMLETIQEHEAEMISLCADPEFSIGKLEEALRKSRNWSPGLEVH
jgi:4-hydroxy-4-methyl-2-oxoglutarate aldolase